MAWLIWGILLVVAVGVGVVVTGFLGMRLSPERQGVPTIRDRLRKYNVDPDRFSEDCLAEIARIGSLTFRKKLSATKFLENMDGAALIISSICFGAAECTAAKIKEYADMGVPNVYWEILAKHDPRQFALDRLQRTQDENRASIIGAGSSPGSSKS